MIDWSAYRKSFAPKVIWTCILIFGIVYIISKLFKTFISEIYVGKVLSAFPQDIWIKLIFLSLIIYVVSRIISVFKQRLLPTLNSTLISLTIFITYLSVVRLNNSYTFYGYDNPYFSWLKFSDIVMLAVCLTVLNLNTFKEELQKSTSSSLLEDDPDPTKHEDQYGSEGYASRIAKHISDTTTNHSFAIGVFAEWGSGKTNFLLRLRNILRNDKDNLPIDFNPWKTSDVQIIIEDLFTEIAETLKPYSRSSSEKIKEYSKKIFQAGDSVHYRAIDAILGHFIKDKSISDRYRSINRSIKQTGKRLIIFVDDLDRLTGEEVLEVLRLIRNTANFSNTFFIVALDQNYITSVLRKTSRLFNEDQYLKKIFQLIITLPRIRKDNFSREIKSLLKLDSMNIDDKESIEKVLTQISFSPETFDMHGLATPRNESYLESMLHNMRDVKRFVNSFKINFEMLKGEVDVYDLFLLELLKTAHFEVYEKIATKEFLSIDADSRNYVLHEGNYKKFQDGKGKTRSATYDENIKSLFAALLNAGSHKSQRRFSEPSNFYIYFSYQLFNLISLTDFTSTINSDVDTMAKKFEEWSLTKSANLNKILDSYTEYKDLEQFRKFVYVYLKTGNSKNYFLTRVEEILTKRLELRSFFANEKEFSDYLKSLFDDDTISPYSRGMIAKQFLKEAIYLNQNVLLSKSEWQEIVYSLFDKFLGQNKVYDESAYNFFLFNDDSRDSKNHVRLNPKAYNRFASYIIDTNKNMEEYLRYFLRPYYQPFEGTISYEPFVFDIFGSKDAFKKLLESFESQNATIVKLKRIILENLQNFEPNHSGFVVSEDDTRFLFDHFKSMGQLLTQQKEISRKFW